MLGLFLPARILGGFPLSCSADPAAGVVVSYAPSSAAFLFAYMSVAVSLAFAVYAVQRSNGVSSSDAWPRMQEAGLHVTEIASMVTMWVPHFFAPLFHFWAYRRSAAGWARLAREVDPRRSAEVDMLDVNTGIGGKCTMYRYVVRYRPPT